MKLTDSFIQELFKLLYTKKAFLEICKVHLKYQFIPKELSEYKLILKSILTQYDLSGNLPSIGVTSQQLESNLEAQVALKAIKETDIVDTELMLNQLGSFIRNVEFQILNKSVTELYNRGEHEEAINLNANESKRINEISLRKVGGKFLKVFGDFKKENQKRKNQKSEEVKGRKVPFFIDPLDDVTNGGMDEGQTALVIMRSGAGKSTSLRWTGIMAAIHGYDVLHIQAEGSEDECRDKYTQIFTKQDYSDIKTGNISKEVLIEIEKLLIQMDTLNRDVNIYAFEKFGGATMVDVREVILEYFKDMGRFPELVIIDSLDLLKTGLNNKIDNDPTFKKERLQTVAQLMKNLAVEFKPIRILTATQTGDINPIWLNDPANCITRSHTEGDRTLVKPFSYVYTGNQTDDEEIANTMRIFIDKLRFESKKKKVYPICTNFDNGCFYHSKNTIKKFYSNNNI